MAFADKQNDNLPEFCYGFNKGIGTFFYQAPYLRLTLQELIHFTFSMLPSTSFNGDVILFTTTVCPFFSLLYKF
jgi:hypothetical protein